MLRRTLAVSLLALGIAAQAAEPLVIRVWPERPAGTEAETVVERD